MPKRKKHVAEIASPSKGVATYKTETGSTVFWVHWSADPLKDPEWAKMVASEEPGGINSLLFLQEFEGDDEARSSERIYWAFDRQRNIVDPFPIPREWPIYLGADFGHNNPTAILFNAQNPATKQIYVFDSIYTTKGLRQEIKEEIYEKLARHLDIPLRTLLLEGAKRHIRWAIPDPLATPYIEFYNQEPFAVPFSLREDMKSINKHTSGEAHVNEALWPSFTCCDKRQLAGKEAESIDLPEEATKCAYCKKEQRALPILYLIEGAAPELAEQFELLSWQQTTRFQYTGKDGAPKDEKVLKEKKEVGAPDHAADAERYVLMTLEWDADTPSTEAQVNRALVEQLSSKPPSWRTPEESLILIAARQAEQQDKHTEQRKQGGRGRQLVFGHSSRQIKPWGETIAREGRRWTN